MHNHKSDNNNTIRKLRISLRTARLFHFPPGKRVKLAVELRIAGVVECFGSNCSGSDPKKHQTSNFSLLKM